MSHPLINTEIYKPARYLGNEYGAVHKPWDLDDQMMVRWCLTYPELYEVGASNLGHIILYNILNAQVSQLCDRAYLPGVDLSQKLRATNSPLFAVESGRSLREFDILGFSLSYELGATNILEMLDLAQIPLTWQERNSLSLAECPLIFAGGQTATSNPEPYADFCDFFALGDGEELLPEVGVALQNGKTAGKNRFDLLLDLAQVPGVYVPQFYGMNCLDGSVYPLHSQVPARILRRVAAPKPEYSIGLVPLVKTVHDRLTIEIRRGCTRGCRFCQPGMLTRPARDVPPEAIVNTIERAVRETGYNDFSLLSLSCSDYLALPAVGIEIKNRLKDENVVLSLPSQRVDRFDANIANILRGTGQEEGKKQGLTFAPEAGTQRLRDVINKGLTDEELLRGVKTAHEQGWDKVKLYFMIGLPTETDEDVLGIAQTIAWLQTATDLPKRKRISFNITISNFTPKPHTPFQWHSVSTEEFLHKQQLLRQAFRAVKGVKVNFTNVEISAMEDFLGRGNRRLGKVIKRAWQLGAGMDAWFDNMEKAYGAWTGAIAEMGMEWQTPILTMEQNLPWDHIDTGIDRKWLLDDFHRAIAEKTVPDCSFHGCSRCGICGPEFGHNQIVPPLPIPEYVGERNLEDIPRVQRVRLTFGKLGRMAMISHLDLMRFMERALRRAALPVSYSCGFNPQPRIAIANAISLGYTSSGELVDLEFSEYLPIKEIGDRLSAQFTDELPIYGIEEIPLTAISVAANVSALAYTLTLVNEAIPSKSEVAQVLAQILEAESIPMPKKTKSGRTEIIDLRQYLELLELFEFEENNPEIIIKYIGKAIAGGFTLKPDYLVFMLNQFSTSPWKLQHIHRDRLVLSC